MNRSTSSSRTSRYYQPATPIPFSIDHILSNPIEKVDTFKPPDNQLNSATMIANGEDMFLNVMKQAQWYHQQQQLMTALLHQQSISATQSCSNLIPSTIATSASSPNFLSCFISYMLAQQQQQNRLLQTSHQQSLHPLTNQMRSYPMSQDYKHQMLNSPVSPSIDALKPMNNQKSTPGIRDTSPLSECYTNNSSSPMSYISSTDRINRDFSSSRLSESPESNILNDEPSSGNNRQCSPNHDITQFPIITSSKAGESTALSSLSNFVTEMVPDLVNSETENKRREINSSNEVSDKSISQNMRASSKKNCNNRTSDHSLKKSDNISRGEMVKNDSDGTNTSKLISSAATGSAIQTTLSKAPPELVQKQPAWVFCTRYSDRPSAGPRTRRVKSKGKKIKDSFKSLVNDDKRSRTAFTSEQLDRLRQEFQTNSYLDEKRRKELSESLQLNENQIKIWFQNKRAKLKKQNDQPNPLRGLLVAGGLYNHRTATSDCSEFNTDENDCNVDDERFMAIEGKSYQDGNCGDNPIGSAKRSHKSIDHDQNQNQLPGKRAKLLVNNSGAIMVANSGR